MIDDFSNFLAEIGEEYNKLSDMWLKNDNYKKINLRKIIVNKIDETDGVYETILLYRSFINENIIDFTIAMQKYNREISTISARIKSPNSIEYKIKNYIENHENGTTPINKCFNDLFGIRIIYDNDIEYDEINKIISGCKYKCKCKIKCNDVVRNEYKAIHIYFMRDRYTFPWELQIWTKNRENSNMESHAKYKQEYTKWERENKGGV